MLPWPAHASSKCIFCASRQLFTQVRGARSALRLHFNANPQRRFKASRTHAVRRSSSTEGENLWSSQISRDKKAKDGKVYKGSIQIKLNGNRDKVWKGRKLGSLQDDHRPTFAEVGTAILKQLQGLKEQLQLARTPQAEVSSGIATLDPDSKYWTSFEEDITALIEEGSKAPKDRHLDVKQWNLYRKLYKAQMPRSDSTPVPRAEVVKVLQHAYYDHVLESCARVETDLFDPVAEYTDLRYPTEWYSGARSTQRQIHLHVGPTNSGKTYNALKRLEEAGNGYYCGPLRLLAHEVYARFKAKGIPCHLITGDDVRHDGSEDTKLQSSTVEMVDTNTRVDVAVIDEIQMMAHEERGWAWTRAFLGSNAKEVHLCGETRVVPLVRELAASMGDTLHIHNYERLSPLKVMSKSLKGNLKSLRKGDCVVSFSILGIHALKKEIEKETGRRVAIVYGSLPPETRAAQAELFNDPDNDYDYLVASDAIGMGLNLAVKRMIFESVYKYNGRERELLSIPQIKQIAGRAGRYRTAKQGTEKEDSPNSTHKTASGTVGLVTCMEEDDLSIIREALNTEPEPIKAAGLLPPSEFLIEYAARLPKGLPFEYIYQRICNVAKMHPRFKLTQVDSQVRIAKVLDSISKLTISDRICFTASPADAKRMVEARLLTELGKCVADARPVTCVDIPEIPLEILDEPMSGQREYLQALEFLHKSLILYLWLSYRFIAIFKDRDQATYAKSLTEKRINDTLSKFSHSAELKERMRELKKRQIKDSKMISELDFGSGDNDQARLSNNEPDPEDTPIEPLDQDLSNAEPSREDIAVEPTILDLSDKSHRSGTSLEDVAQTPAAYDWGTSGVDVTSNTDSPLEVQNNGPLYNDERTPMVGYDTTYGGERSKAAAAGS